MKIKRQYIFIGIPILFIIAIGACLIHAICVPNIRIAASATEYLPKNTTNVCGFEKTFYGIAAQEFDAPCEDFLVWCKNDNWHIEKIVDKEIILDRYIALFYNTGTPLPEKIKNEIDQKLKGDFLHITKREEIFKKIISVLNETIKAECKGNKNDPIYKDFFTASDYAIKILEIEN